MCLPQKYPKPDTFEYFQAGYRYDAITHKSLVGPNEGDFDKNWYVICSNYFDDPFYVDFSEGDKEFPVYFSWHGAGNWMPVKVAETLSEFSDFLTIIKNIEADSQQAVKYLEEHSDLTNEFWKEVYVEYLEKAEEPINELQITDKSEWIKGKVIITDIGKDKLKLIQFIKDQLNLTPQQALVVSKQGEIEYKEGYLAHLKHIVNQLKAMGATAIFRPDPV
ncbi:SMI1/KNR4 family protein [Cytophagaceae bacterium YF14B1]|uniref:SMI1/KNR4 family protein n=1 Tax=Xanthocytophaga flava TaxID=3048013 RepID=A0AAE3QSB5_9BACT|nr:SMI1/KNR4 family protein [Xanthocytophaga flavus]MDJ1482600.1 SMI1/KNR4 family protein [Xanthocytophaga flavus]